MIVDSHCHLENNEDLDGVIDRARKAGVEFILDAGSNIDNLNEHLQICEKYEGSVFTAVGVHPHQAMDLSDVSAEDIVKAAGSRFVKAIGEAGLDYFYDFSPRDCQIKMFRNNIKAAQISKKPLIIHNRESDNDMIDILRDEYKKEKFKAVVHCYSSSWELAKEAIDMGFYISASGMITFPKADELRQNFAKIPLDRLLVETDAPYLAPVPLRGKVNEPANVVLTAKKLAEIKNMNYEELALVVVNNFKRLFEI